MRDRVFLIVAILCAIPYWVGILLIVASNRGRRSALVVAGAAAIFWPTLFFCSVLQLSFVIPVFTVYFRHGLGFSREVSVTTGCLAAALTAAFWLIVGVWATRSDAPF